MAPGKFDAYIMEVDGKLFVRPSVSMADGGGAFWIKNLTEYDATVVPDAVVQKRSIAVPAGGAGHFAVSASASGAYQYVVWLHLGEVDVRVNAESDPVVIVEP